MKEVRIGTIKQGRILEAGADAEAMEWCCLLACYIWLAQPAFLKSPGPSVQEWYNPQWTGSSPITNEEIALQPDLMEAFFSIGVPSSQMTIVVLS